MSNLCSIWAPKCVLYALCVPPSYQTPLPGRRESPPRSKPPPRSLRGAFALVRAPARLWIPSSIPKVQVRGLERPRSRGPTRPERKSPRAGSTQGPAVSVARGLGLSMTFHDLRHGHASLMLAAGVHLKVVSDRLGHSNIGITADLYSHVAPALEERAAATLDDLLGGGC